MPAVSRGNLFTQKLGIFLDDIYPGLQSLRRRIEFDLCASAEVSGDGVGGDTMQTSERVAPLAMELWPTAPALHL